MGLKIRKDTAANWASNNPTIEGGEQALETDTGKVKWNRSGSGIAYNTLAYYTTTNNSTPLGGGGDVVGPASSVASEVALFDGTTGKLLKRATTTGILKGTSGVLSAATAGTDYYNPGGTDVAVADGGTGGSTASAARTNLGLVIGTDVLAPNGSGAALTSIPESAVTNLVTDLAAKQPLDSDLTTIAGLTATTDNMIQSVGSAWASRTPAQVKTALAIAESDVTNLVTDLAAKQPLDSDLTTIAGLTATTDNMIQSVGSAWASRTPAQVRTALSLVPGTDVQAYDGDLAAIAGLTATTDNFLVSVASAWASRTPAQVRTTLALVIGTNVQAWDADLDTWATKTPPSGTAVGTTDTQTLTNKRVTSRVGTTASSATPSIDCDIYDAYDITALAAAITSVTITGTPTHDQTLSIRIKDNGTARAMATGSSIISSGVASWPTTTAISKVHTILLGYDATFATKWVVLAADATGY